MGAPPELTPEEKLAQARAQRPAPWPLPRFLTGLVLGAFARAYAALPRVPIWQWAETEVWLSNEVTANPGLYASGKTPWVRRLQELLQWAFMPLWDREKGEWYWVAVRRVWVRKCSQSGFTEGCLNGIRWSFKHRPRSTIFAIDSEKEAKNVSARLADTFKRWGEESVVADDKELGTLVMNLKGMRVYFLGSFSSGAFANKFAAQCFADEVDEHGKLAGDTDTLTNLESRFKTADEGFIVGLSKPKKASGPITKAHGTGNAEEFFIRCPHCAELQPLTFFGEQSERPEIHFEIPYEKDVVTLRHPATGLAVHTWKPLPFGETRKIKAAKVRFDHCRDEKTGEWDKQRVAREAYLECGYCEGKITEGQKAGLVDKAIWLPTALGEPGVVSQHMSDLYSRDASCTLGQLALDFLAAKDDRIKLQGFFNHRLGVAWREEARELGGDDIQVNILKGFKRGEIPWPLWRKEEGRVIHGFTALVLGADIGLEYARWVLLALRSDRERAVVDWGSEDGPSSVAELVRYHAWPVAGSGEKYRINRALMDAKYRKTDAKTACLATNGIMFPAIGTVTGRARKLASWGNDPDGGTRLRYLTYATQEAKNALYIDCFKKREPRLHFPENVFERERVERFVEEITKESLVLEEETGDTEWDDAKPNHYGAAMFLANLAINEMTQPRRTVDAQARIGTAEEALDGIRRARRTG